MQKNLETTLARLVSIPSVSSNAVACHEVLEYARSELEPLHLYITSDTDTDNPWLLATTQDTKEPEILLAAHLDVVPADPELFTMQTQGGKLVGRGVYDMKIAAACYLELFKNHIAELRQRNVGLLFTTDEELAGACMPGILERGLRPEIVFLPDGGDDWQIEEFAKGINTIDVVVRGKTAHGSRPWEGDNALHRVMDVIDILRKSFPHQKPDSATLTVTQLVSGTARNQIADHAKATLDFRSFHPEDIKRFRSELEQLAREHDLEMTIINDSNPVTFDKSAPAAIKFQKILEKVTQAPVRFTRSFGASDARFFAQYNIPCIIIEPHGGGRHAPNEWVLAADLPKYYDLIKEWVIS